MRAPCYEDLELAHALIAKGQDRKLWEESPTPPRPIGRVTLEPIRQIATFALPLAFITYCAMQFGIHSFLATIPSGLLLGYLLDRQLETAITAKRVAELEKDRDRYKTVRILSGSLGITPAQVTLDLVEQLAKENERLLRLEAAQAERERQHAKALRDQDAHPSRASVRGAATAAIAATSDNWRDEYWRQDEPQSTPTFATANPVSGLPMMGGGEFGLDVAGHTYGSGF